MVIFRGMNFFMALLATISMELESVKGLLWYAYYRARYCRLGEIMANLGPVTVPPPLDKLLPYLKFAVAVAGVVAAAVVTLAHPPAWAFVVIAVVSALGVYKVPNDTVKAIMVDGQTALDASERAVEAAKTGNFPAVQLNATEALRAAEDGAVRVEAVVKEIEHPAPAPAPAPAAAEPLLPVPPPPPPAFS